MNPKVKGTVNERRSIRILEDAGYRCTRAAGSLGAWDIVGVGATDVVLVQVKTGNWPRPPEMETLQNFPCPAGCRKLLHLWRDWQRLPDVREITSCECGRVSTAGN